MKQHNIDTAATKTLFPWPPARKNHHRALQAIQILRSIRKNIKVESLEEWKKYRDEGRK